MNKRTIIIILISVLLTNAYSQEIFGPIGATWHFGLRENWLNTGEGYRKFEVTKDTIIGNDTCRLAAVTDITFAGDTLYGKEVFSQDSNKVYYYANNGFHLLYDFNADSGSQYFVRKAYEHYGLTPKSDSLLIVNIDSTSILIEGNDTIKIQYISTFEYADSLKSDWQIKSPVYGKAGANYLLPALGYGHTHLIPTYLRCYTDTSILLSLGAHSCNTIVDNKFETPAWLFPLFFEDANGEKDTAFLGYDERAGFYENIVDTIFNEGFKEVDTNSFNIYNWGYPNFGPGDISCDYYNTNLLKKVDINKYFILFVGFVKGKMPITVTWIDSLLNSPNLPFPDISPRPRARMDVYCGLLMCHNGEVPFSCTDYVAPNLFYPATDSLFFEGGISACTAIGGFYIEIVPHDKLIKLKIDENEIDGIKVFPNPVTNELHIVTENSEDYYYSIYNLTGQLYLSGLLNSTNTLMLADLPKGVYVLKLNSATKTFILKLLKQ